MNSRQKLVRGWGLQHSKVEAGELQCEHSSGDTTGKLLGERRRNGTKQFFIYLESQYLKFVLPVEVNPAGSELLARP